MSEPSLPRFPRLVCGGREDVVLEITLVCRDQSPVTSTRRRNVFALPLCPHPCWPLESSRTQWMTVFVSLVVGNLILGDTRTLILFRSGALNHPLHMSRMHSVITLPCFMFMLLMASCLHIKWIQTKVSTNYNFNIKEKEKIIWHKQGWNDYRSHLAVWS